MRAEDAAHPSLLLTAEFKKMLSAFCQLSTFFQEVRAEFKHEVFSRGMLWNSVEKQESLKGINKFDRLH